MKKPLQIAIDGPVASGKGTMAKILAQRLGILYVDTGAMYRVIAWLAKKKKIAFSNRHQLSKLAERADIAMRLPIESENDGRLVTVLVDGEDVSWEIRALDISQVVPLVAKHKEVRRVLVKKQQDMAKQQSVVMEGRDIALRVLPEADLKIYLTADVKVRAQRRLQDLLNRGVEAKLEDIVQEIKERDERDMTRTVDPLMKVPDAWELDTTGLSITETADLIEKRVRELQENIINSYASPAVAGSAALFRRLKIRNHKSYTK